MEVSNLARTAEMRLLNAVCMPADDTKGKARLTLEQQRQSKFEFMDVRRCPHPFGD